MAPTDDEKRTAGNDAELDDSGFQDQGR